MSTLMIVIGLLFMIFKGEIISVVMTLLGLRMIIRGVISIVNKSTVLGVFNIATGALILCAGWLFIKLALYILAACLLVIGLVGLFGILGEKINKFNLSTLLRLSHPVIYILVAACLLFNQGGAISWVFIVSGFFLIVDGAVGLIGRLDK